MTTIQSFRPTGRFRNLAVVLFAFAVFCGRARAADHSKFDEILKNTVQDEKIDYVRIKSSYLPQLEAYLKMLAEAKPSAESREEKLAYYINLYNATMIKAIIDHDPATFKPSDNDFGVFKEKIVHTEGRAISLNELENDIVRQQFNDPRVHAALVCGALSCPPILNHAYTADTLDQTLNENIRRWLSDPKRNEVDEASRTMKLSRIFDWYAADFGGKDKVAEFVDQYIDDDVKGFKVEFKEYDWTLNKL